MVSPLSSFPLFSLFPLLLPSLLHNVILFKDALGSAEYYVQVNDVGASTEAVVAYQGLSPQGNLLSPLPEAIDCQELLS